jgi:hypothetical protein
MPRIPPAYLANSVYLYRDRAAAERGERIGGSGFIAAVKAHQLENAWHIYAVSAKHVVCRSGCATVRVNTLSGGFDIFEFEPHEWTAHPEGDDVVVIPIALDDTVHRYSFVDISLFINRTTDIGPGDDVFMVGRFVNHEGRQKNEPSVRF